MLKPSQREKLEKYIRQHYYDSLNEMDEEFHFLCPFCDGGRSRERTFYLNVENGAGLCHRASCDWKGGAVKFISETMGISFEEAKEMLDMGNVITDDTLLESLMMFNRATSSHEESNSFFNSITIPFDYEDVGTSLEKEEVYKWITRRGYNPFKFLNGQHRVVMPSDAFYETSEGKKMYTIGYVCFIVATREERAFILYDYTGEAKRKTINPPNKVLSRMLYGYNRAARGRSDTVFIVEGIFDAARLMQRGLDAVAIFGTNISEQQVYLLSQLPQDEICICLDHNTKKKTKSIYEMLKDRIEDKDLTYITIEKEGEDPDSLCEDLFWEYFDARRGEARKIDI